MSVAVKHARDSDDSEKLGVLGKKHKPNSELEDLLERARKELNLNLVADHGAKGVVITRTGLSGVGSAPYARVDHQLNLYRPHGKKPITNLSNPNFFFHLRKDGVEANGTKEAYQEHLAELDKKKQARKQLQEMLQSMVTGMPSLVQAMVQTQGGMVHEILAKSNSCSNHQMRQKFLRFKRFIDDVHKLRDEAIQDLSS